MNVPHFYLCDNPVETWVYCVRCDGHRTLSTLTQVVQIQMKNGRPALEGVCPDCGTKIIHIGELSGISTSR